MRYTQVLWLLSEAIVLDEIGNQISTVSERKVYGNQWSNRVEQILDAAVRGNSDVMTVEVHTGAYRGEKKAKVKNKTYEIVTANWRGDKTVLTLERGVNED